MINSCIPVDPGRVLTIFYSATSTRYLADYGAEVSKAILMAPAFFETMDDGFAELFQQDPTQVHGWETFEQLKTFFTKTGGGFYPGKIPDFVFTGIHRNRGLTYGQFSQSFFAEFAEALDADPVEKTRLTEITPKLGELRIPVLLAIGDRDNCVSA